MVDFWETFLRAEAARLEENSLKYFNPKYMSLTRPHLLWSTCGSNPYEVHKAVIQARMLSGRYMTEKLSRHWTVHNSSGLCTLSGCTGLDVGSLEHLLLFCPALSEARNNITELCLKVASESEELGTILKNALNNQTSDKVMQFLLDCSSLPTVIHLRQAKATNVIDRIFYVTRSWCYSIHRSRMNKLGLFHYR